MRDVSPLSGRIHAWLRGTILDVALPPGASISEGEIAERFATSRTPVREALLRLAEEDLVEIRPQRGTYVARLDLARIEEALFVRQAIECAVLERVRVRVDRASLATRCEAIVREQARAIGQGRIAAALEADTRFHHALVEASGLPGVWSVVERARDLHHRIRAIAVPELRSGRRAVADHRAMVRALREGDGDAARKAMSEHVSRNLSLAREIAERHPAYFRDRT